MSLVCAFFRHSLSTMLIFFIADDYLISSAPSRVLSRMRKDDLTRLYTLAGLTDDTESFTKSDIVEAIIAAREDVASLPPSSPLGRGAGSSDYSSDDAIIPDEEATPMPPTYLRRRVTITDVGAGSSRRPLKSRSLSMGHINDDNASTHSRRRQTNKTAHGTNSRQVESLLFVDQGSYLCHRRPSRRSSPATSTSSSQLAFSISSPPAHHLRSRKPSAPTLVSIPSVAHLLDPSSLPTPTDLSGSGTTPTAALAAFTFTHRKGKSKQVEFDDSVHLLKPVKTPSKKSTTRHISAPDSESDLTELEDLEAQISAQPSPRRLRSKDKSRSSSEGGSGSGVSVEILDARRVTPMRNAKRKMKSLKEDDTTQEEDEDEEIEEVDEDNAADEEEEVDELISTPSASASPIQHRRTPMRRRLRSRSRTHEDPSDGDDEDEMDEEEGDEEGAEAEEEEEEEEDDEETIAVEPRKLRNGKIVGEEDVDMIDEAEEEGEDDGEVEEDAGEEGDEEGENEGSEEGDEEEVEVEDDASIDLDGDGDTDEEMEMEDEDSSKSYGPIFNHLD